MFGYVMLERATFKSTIVTPTTSVPFNFFFILPSSQITIILCPEAWRPHSAAILPNPGSVHSYSEILRSFQKIKRHVLQVLSYTWFPWTKWVFHETQFTLFHLEHSFTISECICFRKKKELLYFWMYSLDFIEFTR